VENKIEKAFHYETDPPTAQEFGIWDGVDSCWIGDAQGARIFAQEDHARACATILCERMQLRARFRAVPFVRGKKKHAGEFTPPLSAREAWRRIEGKDDGSWTTK